jgi:hypothetical protein
MEMMNTGFSYHCGSCKELIPRVSQGACPICGSQCVIPLGWYQLSVRERSDWLRRIRGQRRKDQQQMNAGRD